MANEEGATRKLFEDLYLNQSRPTATAKALKLLADTLGRDLTRPVVEVYLASLSEFGVSELVLTFTRATDECKFFPPPATLREFSGRAATGDPIASEAKAELLKLIAGMRGPHGPMLKPILGKILYGTEDDPKDAEGNRTHAPIRGEGTAFCLTRRTEAALVRIGWGDRMAGIALLADHPAVRRNSTFEQMADGQYRQNQLRAGDEILKRFTDAYREV